MVKYFILNNYDMGIGKSSLGILVGILLVSILAQDYVEVDAAKRGTITCTPGYSASATYTLTEGGDVVFGPDTRSCPPTQTFSIPIDYYDDLEIISYTVTDPRGNTVTGPPGGPTGNLPFGGNTGVHSYVCNSPAGPGCVADPAAPTFLQAGEFILAGFDDGTSSTLTVNLYEIDSGHVISDATVTAIDSATKSPFTTGITNSSGTTILTLDNGGEYYLTVESTNHWPQSSDAFLIVNDHIWTMVLTPGTPNAQQTIQDLQNQINDLNNQINDLRTQITTGVVTNNVGIWIGIGLAIGIIIGVVIAFAVTRRRNP